MKPIDDSFRFELKGPRPTGPVECLGMTFENEEKRRDYFLEKLRKKLKDPEFRKIEGFPIGADEDILALSDPPYYTACPNPFIAEFIKHYGKSYDPHDGYDTEPFAADITEGRHTWLYKAHTYHTKVPPKAIQKFVEHYTNPGDIVLDGFAGSGMTAVAALLANPTRSTLTCDLSPAASFIGATYLAEVEPQVFLREANRIADQLDFLPNWGGCIIILMAHLPIQYATILYGRMFSYVIRVAPKLSSGMSRSTRIVGSSRAFFNARRAVLRTQKAHRREQGRRYSTSY